MAAKRRAERHLAAQLLTSPAAVGSQTPAKWLALEGTFPAASRGVPDAAHPPLVGSLVLETAFPAVLPLSTSATVGPLGPVRLGEPAFVAPTVRPPPPVLPIGEHEVRLRAARCVSPTHRTLIYAAPFPHPSRARPPPPSLALTRARAGPLPRR